MKRAIAILLSLAMIIALCPPVISNASEVDYKISHNGQTVPTASESYENWGIGIAKLLDGDVSTRFVGVLDGEEGQDATFTPMWIQLDLQQVYTIDKVEFNSWANGSKMGLPTAFTIQVSTDGTRWDTVHTETDMPLTVVPNSSLYSFPITAVDARYVKLDVTAIGEPCDLGNYVSLSELAVYGTEKTEQGGDEETPDPNPKDGKLQPSQATASPSLEIWGFGMANLIDGSQDTMFCGVPGTEVVSEFTETWIQVDLGQKYTVDQFKFFSYAADDRGRPNNIVIETSLDGQKWDVAYENENVPITTVAASTEYAFTFPAAEAQYVKLTVKGVAADYDMGSCVCLREVEVYGVGQTEQGGGEEEMPEPNPEDVKLQPNQATASASLEMWGFGVANLIDGIINVDTLLYCSSASGEKVTDFVETWIQVDLGQKYTVDQFKFFSYAAGNQGRPNNIVIETSLDGKEWKTAYQNANVPLTTVPDSTEYAFTFQAVEAQYIKLTIKSVAADYDLGNCVCLREVEVYGLKAEEEKEILGDKLDINAENVTVSGEYTPDMGKENLFDGKLDSAFAAVDPEKAPATRMDEWFQIDLQKVYSVDKIRLANRSDAVPLGGLPSVFDVLVSKDGDTWETATSVDGIRESDITEKHWLTVEFDAVEARYVRVRVYDIGAIGEPNLGYAVALREFEVYEAGKDKIDLSSFVAGIVDGNASGYPQDVVTASQSYELWGWGVAGLIDGEVGTLAIFCCRPNSDAAGPVEPLNNEITVDLKAAYFLTGMRFASLTAGSLAGLPIDFQLAVSLDGAGWTTVLTKTGLTTADADGDGQFYTFPLEQTEAIRFIRLTITKLREPASEELGYCAVLSELELYGILDPTTTIKPDGYGKVDLSKAIVRATNSYNLWGHGTGNLYNGNANQNLFIGVSEDDADYYVMFKDVEEFENTSNEFIKIRLDGVYEIDLMRFQSQFAASGRGVPNSYTLEVSMDGEQWEPALSVEHTDVSTDDWYQNAFAPVQARYLRLRFHNFIEAGDLGYAAHLKELEFYGSLVSLDEVDLNVPAPEPPALEPLPGGNAQTGDEQVVVLMGAILVAATVMLAVLVLNRRKIVR